MKNFTTPYLPEKGYKRIIVVSIYLLIAYVLYAFLSKWLMLCITPFILGWLAAYIVQKPVTTLYEKKHIPKKITSAFYIILLTSLPASVLFLLAYALYAEVMRENAYLSRTIKVEEGQKVVDTGLYGIVRHPMYAATILLFLMMPIVLGSWYALIVFAFYPAIIIVRLKDEEALLTRELPGYAEYTQKVKYRLIPFLW